MLVPQILSAPCLGTMRATKLSGTAISLLCFADGLGVFCLFGIWHGHDVVLRIHVTCTSVLRRKMTYAPMPRRSGIRRREGKGRVPDFVWCSSVYVTAGFLGAVLR